MVVEHHPIKAPPPGTVGAEEQTEDEAIRICAAPSLWMGGRQWAQELSALGVKPGETLALACPPGIVWVQGWVAALRQGLGIVPAAAAQAHLTLTPEGHLERNLAVPHALFPLQAGPGVWTQSAPGHGPWQWTPGESLLEMARTKGAELDIRTGQRVLCPGAWSHTSTLLAGVIPALVAGAELHVLAHGAKPERLRHSDSWPNHVLGELAGAWPPPSVGSSRF
ncbi:MAG: hypothetical protein AAFS10_19990 [Myxococcota bacterium]